MTDIKINCNNITKTFARRLVFKDLNYEFTGPNIFGISGPNGSGKSTLMKIITGLISPTKGEINFELNSEIIDPDKIYNIIGFVSPYLVLYDEFSAEENIKIFCGIRGIDFDKEYSDTLFDRFGLLKRKNDFVGGYSSGMKQRVKFIYSLIHKPSILLYDEPVSNLDDEGKESIYDLIKDYSKDKLVVLASNEKSDLALCNDILYLKDFKKVKNVL